MSLSNSNTPNRKRPFLTPMMRAVAAGIVVFLSLALVDQASARLGFTGMQLLADDLLGGVIVGIISFVVERRRNRYLAARLQVIGLMNHHVRNSLQAIRFAHYSQQEVRLIDDAVARIEWALREVLPGELKAPDPTLAPKPPQSEGMAKVVRSLDSR